MLAYWPHPLMTALVPESEVADGAEHYFEGAAMISDYNYPFHPLGYAMV